MLRQAGSCCLEKLTDYHNHIAIPVTASTHFLAQSRELRDRVYLLVWADICGINSMSDTDVEGEWDACAVKWCSGTLHLWWYNVDCYGQ